MVVYKKCHPVKRMAFLLSAAAFSVDLFHNNLFPVNMHIFLSNEHAGLLQPFTLLREAFSMRMGIFTPWERYHLVKGLTLADGPGEQVTTIPANRVISFKGLEEMLEQGSGLPHENNYRTLWHAADMVKHNDWAIREDFNWIVSHGASEPLPGTVTAINPAQIFIEKGARISHCTINAETGPVYIGNDAGIMEGCLLRGPLAIGNNAVIKMGAKIYGATTIGPYCMAGGEIKNSILMGYSNKAHDGYLGDSVLGEWCNLGAGTSNSNIKNTAGEIMLYAEEEPYNAGTKCGLVMGDYSRSAINTSFNTGTVVGICCNVFGAGLTPKYIPNFSWGLSGELYRQDAAVRDVQNWMALKGKQLEPAQEKALRELYTKWVPIS